MTYMPKGPEVSARQVAAAWLARFTAGHDAGDPVQLGALFRPDSHWRDLLALTWTIATVSERDVAAAELLGAAIRSGARGFEIHPSRCPPRDVESAGEAVVEAIVRFETAAGEGVGLVRITRADVAGPAPQAWTLLTALRSLEGHDGPAGGRWPDRP